MSYAIFRVEPINKLSDLAQIGSHNKREKKAYKSNPDIDITKTKKNVELVPLSEKYIKGFYNLTKEYKKEHDKRMETMRDDRKKTFKQMIDDLLMSIPKCTKKGIYLCTKRGMKLYT